MQTSISLRININLYPWQQSTIYQETAYTENKKEKMNNYKYS
ncbi:hypothetical protein SDC9_126699 [bioreactor metagenome]|uniref:Uncharacterized protein n=1 Tax=bioreactor metagenome TaxID=1076179 RepID=A0A645CRE0_9ZZZZ